MWESVPVMIVCVKRNLGRPGAGCRDAELLDFPMGPYKNSGTGLVAAHHLKADPCE